MAGCFEKFLNFSIKTQKEAQPTDFSEGCASKTSFHLYVLLNKLDKHRYI